MLAWSGRTGKNLAIDQDARTSMRSVRTSSPTSSQILSRPARPNSVTKYIVCPVLDFAVSCSLSFLLLYSLFLRFSLRIKMKENHLARSHQSCLLNCIFPLIVYDIHLISLLYRYSTNFKRYYFSRYMKFFPRPTRAEQQLSYEVSDKYFTDHDSPYRASNLLKSAKILIVLDDPVKRAFYHYQVSRVEHSELLLVHSLFYR